MESMWFSKLLSIQVPHTIRGPIQLFYLQCVMHITGEYIVCKMNHNFINRFILGKLEGIATEECYPIPVLDKH